MDLFKNKVGRPSNEVISKRRRFYIICAVFVALLVGTGVFYAVKYFSGGLNGKSKNAESSCAQPFSISLCENEGYYGRPQGDAIEKLQEMLKEAGYHYGYVNGNYGSYTVDAVKRAQKAYGLSQTGQADYQLVQIMAPKYNYGYTIITYNSNGGTGTIYGTKDNKQFIMRANTPISPTILTKSGSTHVGWTATSKSRYGSTTYYYGCNSTNCTKPTMYTEAQKNSLGSKFVPYVFTPSEKVHSDTLNALDGVLVTFNAYYCSSANTTYNKSTSSCAKGTATKPPSTNQPATNQPATNQPSNGGGITDTGYPKTITVKFMSNGSNTKDETHTCTLKTSSSTCKIKVPVIVPKTGFKTIMWSMSPTVAERFSYNLTEGKEATFTESVTYYAYTQSTAKYVGRFNKGTGVSSISETNVGCYRYNGASTCSITSPKITPSSGYTALGWSSINNASNASVLPGGTINLSRSTDYYTVAKKGVKVYSAIFRPNGSLTNNSSERLVQCTTTESSCKVSTPTITPKSGFTALGWNTVSSATSSAYLPNSTITLHSNNTVIYYAITRSSSPFNAYFNKGTGVSSVGEKSKSCYRYNGATSCSVTLPSITAKSGY